MSTHLTMAYYALTMHLLSEHALTTALLTYYTGRLLVHGRVVVNLPLYLPSLYLLYLLYRPSTRSWTSGGEPTTILPSLLYLLYLLWLYTGRLLVHGRVGLEHGLH